MDPRPRRALGPEPTDDPRPRLPRTVLAGTLVAGLTIVGAYTFWGPRPAPEDPVVATPSVEATPSPTEESPTADPTPDPSGVGPADPSPEPTEPSVGLIQLNDTAFTPPVGWSLYGDDLIETDRRVVRLSHTDSGASLQVVTLVADPDLGESCRALVQSQGEQFAVTSEHLALPVGLDATVGEGVTCGFTGVRTDDGIANSVSFTLVRRASDAHVLMLRQTVPDEVPAGSPARRDLSAMGCEASTGFAAPLPLC